MDVTKINGLLNEALTELNGLTDAEYTARRLTALRPLDLAAKAIQLALTHLTTAAERSARKSRADAPAPAAAAAPTTSDPAASSAAGSSGPAAPKTRGTAK